MPDKEVILGTKLVVIGFKGYCEVCGESFVGHPQGGGRYRKYCSEACRYKRYRTSEKGRATTRRWLEANHREEKDA